MSRDHRKLRVFQMADALVIDIYHATRNFPVEERYGLQAQLRRAAVSAASNVVEGCARRGTREYLNFLNISVGSTSECRYLLDLSARLKFLTVRDGEELEPRCAELIASLVRLIHSLESHP